MAPSDRRRQARHTFPLTGLPPARLRAVGAAGRPTHGRLLDLSPDGVGVLLDPREPPPAVGTIWSIALSPPGGAPAPASVRLAGEVRSADRRPEGCRCGFRLIAPVAATAEEFVDALFGLLHV